MTRPDDLAARADTLGVARSYQDWAGETVAVADDVVEAVLAQLGDPADAPAPADAPVGRLPTSGRTWGLSLQVYALHSPGSWGMGDLADLRDVVGWSGRELGAGLVLVNPLHAAAPTEPQVDSPYSPSSRRFVSPLYLRVEDTAEYAAAPAHVRAQVDALRLPPPDPAGLVDRTAVWRAKSAALALLAPAQFAIEDEALRDFATFNALAEVHGLPWQEWPADLRGPAAPGVAAERDRLRDRVSFHAWLQRCCEQQLAAVQAEARAAGMTVGVVHDLAVGVDPGGADAWALQDVLAGEVTVGAPPDSFNQQGQDWALPPWRPDALAASGYAPFRAMLTATLARGGGIRIDHVMGLFRLWWVPPGETADRGTYVAYDDVAMLGAVVDVARERGALVVGEDLGTVEPRVRTALDAAAVLGSAVLWFERVDDDPTGLPLPPSEWREGTMASISTHDLPTAAGFLAGEQVRVRDELGQLGRPVEAEWEQHQRERGELLDALVASGALAPADRDDVDAVVLAMHAQLAMTPSRVLLVSPYDVTGELRQPNLPGTVDQYPNWRIPLPVDVEGLRTTPLLRRVAELFRQRN